MIRFAQSMQSTFNFKKRFKRFYPTVAQKTSVATDNIYTAQTWKKRFDATYRFSKQWFNYIGCHLIEVLIGGIDERQETFKKKSWEQPKNENEKNVSEVFGGLTTIALMSVIWCLGSIQNAVAKKWYSNLYRDANKRSREETPMFPIMEILGAALIFHKPHAYTSWTTKAIVLAALVFIPQLLVEVLTGACMAALKASTMIGAVLKRFLLPGFSFLVAGLIAVVGIIPSKIANYIHTYRALNKEMNKQIFENNSVLDIGFSFSPVAAKQQLSTITSFVVKHSTIKALSLQNVKLDDKAAKKIAKNTALLKQLEKLDLRNNNFTGAGVILLINAIIALSTQKQTTIKLDLTFNVSIKSAEMREIATLCANNQEAINVVEDIDNIQNASKDKPTMALCTFSHSLKDLVTQELLTQTEKQSSTTVIINETKSKANGLGFVEDPVNPNVNSDAKDTISSQEDIWNNDWDKDWDDAAKKTTYYK